MDSWTIGRTTYKVSDFLSWQRNEELVLSPSFQRRSVWNQGAKSYLIDTVLRGLPIPVIFLRDLPADLSSLRSKREVVDGQQRIRTLIAYLVPSYLPDFNPKRDDFTIQRSHNERLAGKRYGDLPTDLRQKILDYQFSVHVFQSDTDDRQILQIFARMNSTGVRLNAQELRNAQYYGEFKTLMYSLATEQLPRWRQWHIFTEDDIARMNEVELTSDFAYMMMNGISGRTPRALDKTYKDNEESFPFAAEVRRRFTLVMVELPRLSGQ